MTPIPDAQTIRDELSRRTLVRKAAYTTPAIFAFAAAPRTALGASGPKRKNSGGTNNGPAPGGKKK